MSNQQSTAIAYPIVTIGVTALIAYFSFGFFWGSDHFLAYTQPTPNENGMVSLGADRAGNFLNQLFEILGWIVTTVVSVLILVLTQATKALSTFVAPLIGSIFNRDIPSSSEQPSFSEPKVHYQVLPPSGLLRVMKGGQRQLCQTLELMIVESLREREFEQATDAFKMLLSKYQKVGEQYDAARSRKEQNNGT